jgi:hypothetical protein
LGVVGEFGGNLQAGVAVAALESIPGRPELVTRALDVPDGDGLVEALGLRRAAGDELGDARVIGLAIADGLLEDRRVGGEAREPVVGDQALQDCRS